MSEKEIKRTAGDERLNKLSHYYFDRYSNDLHLFKDVYNCNLIDAFKHFQDVGVLEIITCGATHGYFPILYVNEKEKRYKRNIMFLFAGHSDKPLKSLISIAHKENNICLYRFSFIYAVNDL